MDDERYTCYKRKCRHFVGPCTDRSEHPVICKAFPNGIPNMVLEGLVNHLEPIYGDNGIQYERITHAIA